MSLNNNEKALKKAALRWATDTGGVYLTDTETGPAGVVACDIAVFKINETAADGSTTINYNGSEELKELLAYLLTDVEKINIV